MTLSLLEQMEWPYLKNFEITSLGARFVLSFPEPRGLFGSSKSEAQKKLKEKLAPGNFNATVFYACDLETLKQYLEGAIVDAFCQKYFKVKSGKGKTEKSRKITMKVMKGDFYPESEEFPDVGNASFYCPASLALLGDTGEEYLPAFLVLEKLAELQARSPRGQRYKRVPISDSVPWPLKNEYLTGLLGQIPDLTQMIEERDRKKAAEHKETVQREEQLERERQEWLAGEPARKAASEAAQRKAAEAKARKRAKMEQIHCVDIVRSWSEQVKDGGYKRFKRFEMTMENVSLYFAGSRVYIVDANGDEMISTRGNVRIVEREETV